MDINAFASIKGTTNLFKRHGYINEDGIPYSIRTHQIRHLLNTFLKLMAWMSSASLDGLEESWAHKCFL